MSLTIGLAGMDPATETALKAAFQDANERLGNRWQLLPETQADHIVVDMDSMYGPMSWLRLHAAGKQVVGLTSAARAQTDFRLGRPFNADSVATLLQDIAEGAGEESAAAAPTRAEASVPATDEAARPAPAPAPAPPSPAATAPAPEPQAPAVAAVASAPARAQAREPSTLFEWLISGRLDGLRRYRRSSGPTLLIDMQARSYHGPAALKPLMPYFEGELAAEALEPVDAGTFQREAEAIGAAQPLSRLVWLGGLVSGGGRLLPGHDPEARYTLNRWPQTEREFPRHFRIATTMMKAPAALAEVAAASGIALEEIVDFVNANLATGVAEAVAEPDVEPAPQPRSGGLLGRLRGR
jgi:hypothetical protein